MVRRCYQLYSHRGRVTATVLATSLPEDGATTPLVSCRYRVVASDSQETRNRQVFWICGSQRVAISQTKSSAMECFAAESAQERETCLSSRCELKTGQGRSASSNYATSTTPRPTPLDNNMHPGPVPTTANQLGCFRSLKCLAFH